MNWSTGGGDLRAAHFFGLHALQVLPLLGFWIDRRSASAAWVRVAAAAYFLIYAVVLAQALAGRPLLAALAIGGGGDYRGQSHPNVPPVSRP